MLKDVVLDVGCGTGILSMFAAKSGAKLVISVDMSNIIEQAKIIVKDNGLSDKIVLLKGKMEEVELPVKEVDIIISEWMGYFLLYESMLDTVIYARDKYLKEGGLIFPDKASMFISAIEDEQYRQDKLDCKNQKKAKKGNFSEFFKQQINLWFFLLSLYSLVWDNVYGFNMSSIKEIAIREPLVDTVESKAVVTDSVCFKDLNLLTTTKENLAFTSEFELTASRDDHIHAFLAYFDIDFACCHKPLYFSTGPHAKYTHWKQTVFYLKEKITLHRGEKLKGSISVKPHSVNPRDLDISITYQFEGRSNDPVHQTMTYKMC